MQNPYIVYMHVNKINQKKYIGITKQKAEARWANGNGYRKCPAFYAAINKYGWDNFQHIIIQQGLTQQQACNMQIMLIQKYDTTKKENGYNISTGGNVPIPFFKGKKLPSYIIDALRKANVGKQCSDQTRQKLSIARAGHQTSDQTKKLISEKLSGKPHYWDAGRQKVEIKCVQLNKIFQSLSNAAKFLNKDGISNISKAADPNYPTHKTAYGYHWEFV